MRARPCERTRVRSAVHSVRRVREVTAVLEIAGHLLAVLSAGHRVAVATVVSMTGSAPTVVGTSMAVDDTGAALGSVAGGCVEGALYELCTSVLDGAAPGVQDTA